MIEKGAGSTGEIHFGVSLVKVYRIAGSWSALQRYGINEPIFSGIRVVPRIYLRPYLLFKMGAEFFYFKEIKHHQIQEE